MDFTALYMQIEQYNTVCKVLGFAQSRKTKAKFNFDIVINALPIYVLA